MAARLFALLAPNVGLPCLIIGRNGTVCHQHSGLATKTVEPIVKALLSGTGT